MSRGYVVAMLTINDAEAYKPYMETTKKLVEEYQGRYLIRGKPDSCKEGIPHHDRLVVIEFDNFEKADAFYNDQRYADIKKVRQKNSEGFLFLSKGYAS